jgi:hypothetical protein
MNETYGGSSTAAYVVAVLIALWSALAIHAMGSLCDRSPSSISVQILSTVLGAILFDIEFWLRYNSLANPSGKKLTTKYQVVC